MKLLTKTGTPRQVVTGRLSDGSDRQTTTVTDWVVTVQDDDGVVRQAVFDHDPSSSEVYAALPAAAPLTPTTQADWARAMRADYEAWWRWKQTRVEAQSRALAAAVVNALLAQENAAWGAYVADVQAWASAT